VGQRDGWQQTDINQVHGSDLLRSAYHQLGEIQGFLFLFVLFFLLGKKILY
jgi:hypothetical protein